MHRDIGLHSVSRRSMMVALATMLPFCRCFAQEFTVSVSDAEKAAHDYLADLTAGEVRTEGFWYLDRNFNRELDKLARLSQDAVKLKEQWSATIKEERASKMLEVEAFSNDANLEKGWEKRHPGFAYSDPSHSCWLVFRTGAKIDSVSVGEKEANFEDEKVWVHVLLHYVNREDSPDFYDVDRKQKKKLHRAEATLWIEKPTRNAHLYVYDQCWLSDIEPWT
jgi:hypothetical protein